MLLLPSAAAPIGGGIRRTSSLGAIGRSLRTSRHFRLPARAAAMDEGQEQQQQQRLEARPAAAQPVAPHMKGRVVAREARMPEGKETIGVVQALQQLFPDTYTAPTGAKRACRRKEVLVGGIPVDTTAQVAPGQLVQLLARSHAAAAPTTQLQKDMPPLEVLYEDDHVAVVYKPDGIPTQGSGDTAHGRIKAHLKPSQAQGALYRPQHAHRLDAPTSGLLIAAKSRQAITKLREDFATRAVKKRYLAILKGQLEEGAHGVIDFPLQGKSAVTEWEVLQVTPSASYGHLTTISFRPHTGRKHQLRRHAAEVLGAPILGDARYRAAGGRQLVAALAGGAARRAAEAGRAPGEGGPSGQAEDEEAEEAHGEDEEEQDEGGEDDEDVVAVQEEEEEEEEGDKMSGKGCEAVAAGGKQGASLDLSALTQAPKAKRQRQDKAPSEVRGRRMDMIAGGIGVARLCLCAAELKFQHPVTAEPMHLSVQEPDFFGQYRQAEAAAAAAAAAPAAGAAAATGAAATEAKAIAGSAGGTGEGLGQWDSTAGPGAGV